ncbi:MAG: response regulator transcription factor [Candidatus Cybelea sp.]
MKALTVVTESPVRPLPAVVLARFRVYVIQQQILMAKALGSVLQHDPSITVVGDGARVSADDLTRTSPNLILLDSETSFDALSNTIGTCRLACPRARIGVLSEHLSPDVMQRAFSAGADGYIVKDILPEELIAAVKTMSAGSLYVDPRLVGFILRRHAGVGRREPNELSRREGDVVRLIAAGLSNREISQRLGLSDKTVKNHISHIFSKLDVTARTQVVVYAIRNGLA